MVSLTYLIVDKLKFNLLDQGCLSNNGTEAARVRSLGPIVEFGLGCAEFLTLQETLHHILVNCA